MAACNAEVRSMLGVLHQTQCEIELPQNHNVSSRSNARSPQDRPGSSHSSTRSDPPIVKHNNKPSHTGFNVGYTPIEIIEYNLT